MNSWQVTVVSLVGTQIAVALVLLLLYQSNTRLKEARMWALALALVSAAWIVNMLRGVHLIPEWLGILVANGLFLFGGYQASAACRVFYNLTVPHRLLIALCVLFSLVLVASYWLGADLNTRQVIFGFAMVVVLLFGTQALFANFNWTPSFLGLFAAMLTLLIGLALYIPLALLVPTDEPTLFGSKAMMLLYIVQPFSTIGLGLFGLLLLAQRMNRDLEKASQRDFLTNALNRRGFQGVAILEFDKTKRFGSVLTLAAIDIDYFKRINDSLGHQAGDLVLKQFSKSIQDEIRNIDVLCRWGGEEFVVLLPGTSCRGAQYLLKRLRERLQTTPVVLNDTETIVRFSSGIVECSGNESSIDEMIDRADELLYQAKENGRNRDEWQLLQPGD